jgi:hypothetical protein
MKCLYKSAKNTVDMSKQGLANVMGLATIDKNFRKTLVDNPDAALSQSNFDLDAAETAFLKEEGTRLMIRDYGDYMAITYSAGGKAR